MIGTNKSIILVVISFLVVAVICNSSAITLRVLAEPSGPIDCRRTGTVAVTCCQEHIINRSPSNPAGTLVKYCTDCNIYYDQAGDWHIKDCGERYIAMSVEQLVPPDAMTKLQGILGKAPILPSITQNERPNLGGLLQTENNLTFSQKDNSSNDDGSDSSTSVLNQSDSILHAGKKATKAVDDEVQEQDDSGGGSDDEVDEPQHQGKNNEDN
jgi:hypothetical protein